MTTTQRPSPLQSLSASLTPKKTSNLPLIMLILGGVVCVGMALFGMMESRRTERVIIAARPIPNGTQITSDDLATIERPLYGQPEQLAGVANPELVVGQYATRDITTNDLLKTEIVSAIAPDQPAFPSGKILTKDMVVLPFSTLSIGPLAVNDLVNIGFNDQKGDPQICEQANAAADGQQTDVVSSGTETARAFSCRVMDRVKVLHVDAELQTAYLEVTPYQSQVVWAIQAAGLQLWGERYGESSTALQALDRIAPVQFDAAKLGSASTITTTTTLPGAGALPGEATAPLVAPEPTAGPTK